MRFIEFLAAGLLAASTAVAHPENLPRSEIARRASMSKRCEAHAHSFNKKRYAKRMAKRGWGDANSTVSITTEAPYCKFTHNTS